MFSIRLQVKILFAHRLRERLRMKNEKLNVALRAVMSRPRGTPADWEPSRQLEQHVRTLKMLIISAEVI